MKYNEIWNLYLFVIVCYALLVLGIFINSQIIFGIGYFSGFLVAFMFYPRDGEGHPFINMLWFLYFPYMATIGNYLSDKEYDEWLKKSEEK